MPGDENRRGMRRTVSFSRPLYAVMSGSKPLAGVRPMRVDQRCEPATDCIEAMSMNKAIAYVFVDDPLRSPVDVLGAPAGRTQNFFGRAFSSYTVAVSMTYL